MTLVLTMAGLGSRFKSQGFQGEKYQIRFLGHSLFEWSLVSLLAFRDHRLVVVTRDFPGVEDEVLGYALALGFGESNVIVLDHETKGQAETALLAKSKCEIDEPILIYNTDTHVAPAALVPPDFGSFDGWIPCFSAPGDKWSFVELGEEDCALRVTEKQRISDHCSIGLYGFSSFKLFEEAYLGAKAQPKEIYVAPLYNHLIDRGLKVRIADLSSNDVCILGTPEDLENAQAKPPRWPV
ncbi:MAG: glycosyltransferase family 2 protein [Fimbriimonadaceae bacterium]